MTARAPALGAFILKVASRCNLDCSYCYVYNKGDATWKRRPPVMSDAVFDQALVRIREHCESSGQDSVEISFHGGEPCLLGARRFDTWCARARHTLAGTARVSLRIQTNGTLLDAEWAEAFRNNGVRVGISVDGPKPIHDRVRLDRQGRGSYDAVVKGVAVLRDARVPFAVLSVIPLGSDAVSVHRHLLSLGPDALSYLLPDFTHDTIAPIRARYGQTPCADFLIPVFDDWWFHGTLEVLIANFWNIGRTILGGTSESEAIGNRPAGYAVVEADGDIEGVDVLRVCGNGMAATGLNVRDASFGEIASSSALHRQSMFEGMPLPRGCRACPEAETCAGGHLPHRWSQQNGFDNPSVWCADLLKLFAHIRRRFDVPFEETRRRRGELRAPRSAAPQAAAAL
jgi:uncharacterized protein